MGGGDNSITIKTILDTTGFTKGTQQIKKAVSGLASTVQRIGNAVKKHTANAGRSLGSVASVAKRIIPMLIGVGSAYQIISRAVNAFMSENQKLSSQMSSVWTALGNMLGPIITQVITWITTAISYFIEFLRLLGITSKTASQASKSAKGAGSELKKTIAGFDELNLLQENGGGGGGGAGLEDKEAPQWIKDIADFLKQHEWEKAGKVLADKLNEIVENVKWEEIGKKIGFYLNGALTFIESAIRNFDWANLGKKLAEGFNSLIHELDGPTIGRLLVAPFVIGWTLLTNFLANLNTAEIATKISDAIVAALNYVRDTFEETPFKEIGQKIRTFFENIKWEEIRDAIFGVLEQAWNGALDLLWGLFSEDTENEPPIIGVLRDIGKSVEEFGKAVTEFFGPAWDVLEPVLNWLTDNILVGVLETLREAIDFLTEAIKGISDALEGLVKWLNGDIKFGEFIGGIDGVTAGVLGLGSAIGGIKGVSFLSSILGNSKDFGTWIESLTKGAAAAKGGLEGVAEAAGSAATKITTIADLGSMPAAALGEFGTVASMATAGLGGLLAALGLVPAIMLDSKLSADFLADGLDNAGDSTLALAEQINVWNEMASHQEDFLWDTTGATNAYGYSLQEARYAEEAAVEAKKKLAEAIGITVDELNKQIKAAGGDVTQIEALKNASNGLADSNAEVAKTQSDATQAIDAYGNVIEGAAGKADAGADQFVTANEKMKGAAQETAGQAEVSYGEVESAVSGKLGNASETGSAESEELQTNVSADLKQIEADAKEAMGNIETAVDEGITHSVDKAKSGMGDLKSAVSTGFSNIKSVVSNNMSAVGGILNQSWASISGSAYRWGADMIGLMNNGIVAAVNQYLHPTVAQVAQMIRNYLGFSKPKMGPLADADTYMPDFMELMADGLRDNIPVAARAASKVAEAVSDEIQDGNYSFGAVANSGIETVMDNFSDKIVTGFADMISQLESIADRVTFSMPVVAGGGFLPYSAGSSVPDFAMSDKESELLEAVGELRELIERFMSAVDNMQWVAQFEDFRAIAKRVTQIQKQDARSRG